MRTWKTVWKQMIDLEVTYFGIPRGTTFGIIKLQEKPKRKGGFKYRVVYKADGYLQKTLDMDIFELSYPSVYDEYVITN